MIRFVRAGIRVNICQSCLVSRAQVSAGGRWEAERGRTRERVGQGAVVEEILGSIDRRGGWKSDTERWKRTNRNRKSKDTECHEERSHSIETVRDTLEVKKCSHWHGYQVLTFSINHRLGHKCQILAKPRTNISTTVQQEYSQCYPCWEMFIYVKLKKQRFFVVFFYAKLSNCSLYMCNMCGIDLLV